MSKRRVLSFRPQLRLEWQGQDGRTKQSIARSFRQLRRFHHGFNLDKVFGGHSYRVRWQNGSQMLTTCSMDASDMPTTMIGLAVTLAFSLVACTMPTSVWAAGPTLTVSADGGVHTFDRDELLARTDVVDITTSRDVAYRTPRTYRAVALAKLLEGVAIPSDAVVEAAAQDGFVTQIPRDLIYANDGIVAYMAIEVAGAPWPPIPGKDKSAGPFYIVWLGHPTSSLPIIKWPYQVISLSVQDAPAKRCVNKRSRLTPPSLGRSMAWLADRQRD